MSGQKKFTITELAKEFDVTTRAVRFYEEKGLLKPERVGRKRLYSVGDKTKLKLILRGKRLGLSLEESREIINLYNPKEGNRTQLLNLIDKIRERRDFLHQQMVDIENTLKDLKEAEKKCLSALNKK
jgi:DNA-binding transcriptional MerR regulator